MSITLEKTIVWSPNTYGTPTALFFWRGVLTRCVVTGWGTDASNRVIRVRYIVPASADWNVPNDVREVFIGNMHHECPDCGIPYRFNAGMGCTSSVCANPRVSSFHAS